MALYQSIHTGQHIDEQISAVSEKLPLTGGTVNGIIQATQFKGPLDGTATKVSNMLTMVSNNTVIKDYDGSKSSVVNFIAGNNITLTPQDGSLTISSSDSYSLPEANDSLGGIRSGGVATISNGQITAISKATSADSATNATNATNIYSSGSTDKAYILGTNTASNANHATVYNTSVYTLGSVLYGAAWNDYAEYRQSKNTIEAGYCVTSDNNGIISKTTKRLQYCEGVVSDTFGFAIGETEECQTPIAVSGRVLVYFNDDISNYNAGDPVCAGPNGKISKMTREEVSMYPDRLIGTISEIPQYDTWGENNIQVNNRIWIKVK